MNQIHSCFEGKQSMALTLCDLSKAFDCVSHAILLDKLKSYSVGGTVLRTFGSYLEQRHQILSVGGASSAALPVKHGVPQGSVIGPVLFLIMVNDIGRLGDVLQFADDTTFFLSGASPAEAIDAAARIFGSAEEWFQANKLQLNQSKTQRLVCSLSRLLPETNEVLSVSLLGFTIDYKLSWDSHVSDVCRKLSRVTYLLRRLKPMLTDCLKTVYFALFHSHIGYGLLLRGHSTRCVDILLLQKRAVRLISSSGHLEPCRPIFARLGILTV